MKQPPETLKEPRKHGNMEFPCAFYNSIRTITSVSHHWHEEMEVLYIEGSGYSVEVDTYDVTTEEPSFYFLNRSSFIPWSFPLAAWNTLCFSARICSLSPPMT